MSRSMASSHSLLDSKAHDHYIYQRLEEISKKISPTPPIHHQHPSNNSPRQLLNSSTSKMSVSPLGRGSLHMEEVKELSNLVMALQESLHNVQNDYVAVLMRAETETRHRTQLEESLNQMCQDLEKSQSELEESRILVQSLESELQQQQANNKQREKHLQNMSQENETYLKKIQSLQTRLQESDETLHETDKIRNASLQEMKQLISQFKIDLEFASSHISILSSQKSQVENELVAAQNRANTLREEIDSLNISFTSVVQNLQNATSLLNNKTQVEGQLTSRIEELEEQLKVKVIALQRNALNSKEFEISLQEYSERYASCENELTRTKQTIQELQNKITALEEECQMKAREIDQALLHKEKLIATEKRVSELENANQDLNVLLAEAEKSISQLDVTIAEKLQNIRELEEKFAMALKKTQELEEKSAIPVHNPVLVKLEEDHRLLGEKYQEAQRAMSVMEGKLSQLSEANQSQQQSQEQIILLKEKITAHEKMCEELRSKLESEISEKETLATRVQYLEDMLESVSQTAMSSTSTEKEKIRSLEAEVKRSQQEVLDLRRELEEARQSTRNSNSTPSVHPVYDIFGLSENFESPSGENSPPRKISQDQQPSQPPPRQQETQLQQQLQSPPVEPSLEISKSNSTEKELKQNQSERRLTRAADSTKQRKVDRNSSVVLDDSAESSQQTKSSVDNQQLESKPSSSSLLPQSSTKIKSSVSELQDPQALKAYRKKLQAEVSSIKKERQVLKKEILEWNEKFEKDNGHEASREDKEKLASHLYDRYQDMTATLRKNEAKLERADEKYKSLVGRSPSMAVVSRQPSAAEAADNLPDESEV